MTEIPMSGEGKTYSAPGTRPFSIMFVIVVQLILALGSLGLGVLVLGFDFGDYYYMVIGGIVLILVGILFLFANLGLWNMQPWSWILTVFVNIVQLVGYIVFIVFTGMPVLFGIGQIIISIVLILYFLIPTTRNLFVE